MEQRQEHPAETLLRYTASKLAEQYQGRPEHEKFLELIAALEEKETSPGAPSAEHEQDKLPPAPAKENDVPAL